MLGAAWPSGLDQAPEGRPEAVAQPRFAGQGADSWAGLYSSYIRRTCIWATGSTCSSKWRGCCVLAPHGGGDGCHAGSGLAHRVCSVSDSCCCCHLRSWDWRFSRGTVPTDSKTVSELEEGAPERALPELPGCTPSFPSPPQMEQVTEATGHRT